MTRKEHNGFTIVVDRPPTIYRPYMIVYSTRSRALLPNLCGESKHYYGEKDIISKVMSELDNKDITIERKKRDSVIEDAMLTKDLKVYSKN